MRNLLGRVQANIGRQLLLSDLVATIETDFEEYAALSTKRPPGMTSGWRQPTPITIP